MKILRKQQKTPQKKELKMTNSNLAYQFYEKNLLEEWDYILDEISKVFEFSPEEKTKFDNSDTVKIIATIPFVANCIEPERTAIAHLCLYEVEKRGFNKYCSHLPTDDNDIYKRLAFIATFEGGNQLIIKHGMNILALIMLEGYKRSQKKDIKNNIYNPIASGKWNYQLLKDKLISDINKLEVPELDWVLPNIYSIIW